MSDIVHVDDRKRVTLTRWLRPNQLYRATVNEHGTVTLVPVKLVKDS